MIGVDSGTGEAYVDANVLLRFFTQEPAEMAEQARAALEAAARGRCPLILIPLVLAEVIWTLQSFYGYRRQRIADTLLAFVGARGLVVRERDIVVDALGLYRDKNLDFVDAMIAATAMRRGPRRVCTFDRDFRRIPEVDVVRPGA